MNVLGAKLLLNPVQSRPHVNLPLVGENRRFTAELQYWANTHPEQVEVAARIHAFACDPSANHLDLSGSQLTEVPRVLFLPGFDPYRGRLTNLDLSRNRIDQITYRFSMLNHLETLSLAENRISQLDGIFNLYHLQSLDLSHNELPLIPRNLSELTALRVLDLSANQIRVLPLRGYGWLERLDSLMLEGNPLGGELELPLEYEQEGPLGVQSSHHPGDSSSFARQNLQRRLEYWQEQGAWPQIPELSLTEDQVAVLSEFISRLSDTKEARQTSDKEYLAQRLLRLLSSFKNESFQQSCLDEMKEALGSCGDRISYGLDACEMKLDLQRLSRARTVEALRAFYEVGTSYQNLQAVDGFARDLARTAGEEHEALEYVMALRLKAKDFFDLPTHSTQMLFASYPRYNAADVANGLHAILNKSAQIEQRVAFLSTWEPWQEYLTSFFEEDFVHIALQDFATPQAANDARDSFYLEKTKAAMDLLHTL